MLFSECNFRVLVTLHNDHYFVLSLNILAGESLQSLSAEQLQQLEGMERANVEARIAVLRDVQKLLDSAVLRLNQYSTVMAVIR